jgi:hypothetical protein
VAKIREGGGDQLPTVGVIPVPINPVQVNTATTTSANFTAPDILDTHTAVWDWRDNTTSLGIVTETIVKLSCDWKIMGTRRHHIKCLNGPDRFN